MPRGLFWPFLKFLVLAKAAHGGSRAGNVSLLCSKEQGRQRPACPGQGQHRERPRARRRCQKRSPRQPRAFIAPGRPQSAPWILGSMLKGLGSIPEHTQILFLFFFFFSSNHGNEAIRIYFPPNPQADSRPGCLLKPADPPASRGKAVRCSGSLRPPLLPTRGTHQCCTHRLHSPTSTRRYLLLHTEGLVLKTRLGLRLPDHPPNPGCAHRGAAYREAHEFRGRQICPSAPTSFFSLFPCF